MNRLFALVFALVVVFYVMETDACHGAASPKREPKPGNGTNQFDEILSGITPAMEKDWKDAVSREDLVKKMGININQLLNLEDYALHGGKVNGGKFIDILRTVDATEKTLKEKLDTTVKNKIKKDKTMLLGLKELQLLATKFNTDLATLNKLAAYAEKKPEYKDFLEIYNTVKDAGKKV